MYIFHVTNYVNLFCLRRADEAGNMAEQMIGDYLKTKQTGEGGRICNKVSFHCYKGQLSPHHIVGCCHFPPICSTIHKLWVSTKTFMDL